MTQTTPTRSRTWLAAALGLALSPLAPAAALAQPTLTLDQAMSHPDWIGPPVEQAWWSLDGQQAYYTLKREGSPVRDTWRIGYRKRIRQDDPYYREVSEGWSDALKAAFKRLPDFQE